MVSIKLCPGTKLGIRHTDTLTEPPPPPPLLLQMTALLLSDWLPLRLAIIRGNVLMKVDRRVMTERGFTRRIRL